MLIVALRKRRTRLGLIARGRITVVIDSDEIPRQK